MRLLRCLLLVTLFSLSVPAYADLVTFSSLAAFTAAAPGLPVETFESALVSFNGSAVCTGPLSSASSASACFPAGGLLPGVVYSSSPDPRFVVLGATPTLLLNTRKVLGTGIVASSTLTLTFTSASAVGFEVFPGLVDGPVVVSVFSPSDAELGIFTIPAIRGGSFFGVLSTTDFIGRLSIDGPNTQSGGEFIDNLRWSVPEPSSLLLLATGLALVFRLRKRA